MFKRFDSIKAFSEADISEVSEYIKSCGLFKTKARDIVSMCQMLHEKYNDIIPNSIDELIKLPGVGRKTANLIVGDLYGKPALVCDTHVIRITNLLEIASTIDATKLERQLALLVPPSEGLMLCHRLVWHGRLVCKARNPECKKCCLNLLCGRKF